MGNEHYDRFGDGYGNEDINDEELLKMMMSRIKNEE